MPENHLHVLGNDASGAREAAEALGVSTTLDDDDLELDEVQAVRLEWHLENDDRPMLAVNVMAEQGREVRLRLSEMGGEMLTAPTVSDQVADVSVDPGMVDTEEPHLPPNHDQIYAPN